jgi:hypothetical protein
MPHDATQPYTIAAREQLEDAEELAEHLEVHAEYLRPHERLHYKRLDVYPCLWAYEEGGNLVQVAPRPEADVRAWEQLNRRLAARVLHHWETRFRARMPGRTVRVGWREGRGVGVWEEGLYIDIVALFDDEENPGFQLGLPADPSPLSQAEREALMTPLPHAE